METHNYYKQFWEYLLMISPPDEVIKSIRRINKEIEIKYGCMASFTSNIILVNFKLVKVYEQYLLAQLFSYFINSISFEIKINSYNLFPPHSLYAVVQENDALKRLQNGLIFMLIHSLSLRENQFRAAKKHCLKLAGNLAPCQYKSVSNEYKNKTPDTVFRARNIILLKRSCYENNVYGKRWQACRKFIIGY